MYCKDKRNPLSIKLLGENLIVFKTLFFKIQYIYIVLVTITKVVFF